MVTAILTSEAIPSEEALVHFKVQEMFMFLGQGKEPVEYIDAIKELNRFTWVITAETKSGIMGQANAIKRILAKMESEEKPPIVFLFKKNILKRNGKALLDMAMDILTDILEAYSASMIFAFDYKEVLAEAESIDEIYEWGQNHWLTYINITELESIVDSDGTKIAYIADLYNNENSNGRTIEPEEIDITNIPKEVAKVMFEEAGLTWVEPESKFKMFKHKVLKGQTISKIAKLYNISDYRLMTQNNINDPNAIEIGQMLDIKYVSDKNIYIQAKGGETLSEMANRYNIPVQVLLDINRLENPNIRIAGGKIMLPV